MNMKKVSSIWRLAGVLSSDYAECLHRSPPEVLVRPCAGCLQGAKLRTIYPIVIEWSPGSNLIGDFTWPGSGRSVVKANVFETISSKFSMVRAEVVEMFQDPKLKVPKNKKRAKPRIWLPYDGPSLVELIPTYVVNAHANTSWVVAFRCDVCGSEMKRLDGYEQKEHRWDQRKQDLVPFFVPREPGKGVFVRQEQIVQHPIFFVEKLLPWIFCTDEFKHLIEDQGFSNIDFLEYGEVIDE